MNRLPTILKVCLGALACSGLFAFLYVWLGDFAIALFVSCLLIGPAAAMVAIWRWSRRYGREIAAGENPRLPRWLIALVLLFGLSALGRMIQRNDPDELFQAAVFWGALAAIYFGFTDRRYWDDVQKAREEGREPDMVPTNQRVISAGLAWLAIVLAGFTGVLVHAKADHSIDALVANPWTGRVLLLLLVPGALLVALGYGKAPRVRNWFGGG